MAEVDPRKRRLVVGITYSVTLVVFAGVALLVGTLLPAELAIWGPLTAGTLAGAAVLVFVAMLIGMRRAARESR